MQEDQLEKMNQQATHHQNDFYHLSSHDLEEEHSSNQDGLYYKNLASVMFFVLFVVCLYLAVSYES